MAGKRASKRGNGEGTIGWDAKRKRWHARLTLADGTRKGSYHKTRAPAARWLADAIKNRNSGQTAPDDKVTVGAYLAHWLEHDARHTVKPATFAGYGSLVRVHLDPALGKLRLSALTPRHVEALFSAMLAGGAKPRTVQAARAVLRRALGQAVRHGILARNVAALVTPPKAERSLPPVLSAPELVALVAAFEGHALEAAVRLALGSGLRQGELRALPWDAVELDGQPAVSVRRTYAHDGAGGWRLAEPKTATSRRTVPLPLPELVILRRHRASQGRAQLAAGERWHDEGLVFTTAAGGPLDPTRMLREFRRQLAAAGLPALRWHDLRHLYATNLLTAGTPVHEVARLLGHASPTMTLNTYAHVIPGSSDRAAGIMAAAMGGGE